VRGGEIAALSLLAFSPVSLAAQESRPLPTFELPFASPRLFGTAARAVYVSESDNVLGPGWEAELMLGENIPVVPLHRGTWTLAAHLGFEVMGRFRLSDGASTFIGSDWLFDVGLVATTGRWMFSADASHTSAHVGDEYIDNHDDPIERFDPETIAFWAFYTAGPWRFGGSTTIVYGDLPPNAGPWGFQGGIDYTGGLTRVGVAMRPVAGVYAGAFAFTDWTAQLSAKAGMQMPLVNRHLFTVSLTGFTGADPLGQFFNRDLTYVGVELRLDL
jgi:hypothetical protein